MDYQAVISTSMHGKGPNREKFNLTKDRQTDRQTDTAQVQVLSCAFAAKKLKIIISKYD